MLPAKNRLQKDRDFKRIFRLGRSFFSSFFRLRVLKNDFSQIRLGIVVSSKVSKKATTRNLIKRRIREILRLNISRFRPGYDVSIQVSPKACNCEFKDLEKDLLYILKKANLIL